MLDITPDPDIISAATTVPTSTSSLSALELRLLADLGDDGWPT